MDTAILKRFAQQARRSLQDQVTSKLKFVLDAESAARREHPIAVQKLEEAIKKDGKPSVVDQVAYTWFNRFCALRFMDANRYNGTNIVSPAEAGQYQPEILAEAKLGHIDDKLVDDKVQQKVNRLLSGADPSRDPQAEAYRLLLVSVCNYWNGAMPFLFQRIDDYTELLLPDDLLSENSILTLAREALTDDACQDVEVIGWLYQFYISEKKDEVMARKSAVPTEDIPAVTQLFTPHWIVRYLVENSLGRLWLLNRPGSKLTQQMDYYIKPEEPETEYLRIDSVEDIKVCDPASGSGHMLTYAFDLLYAMYEEEGYAAPEIPKLILSKNLFGIEIDDRAGELAAFALTMKARAKDRRIFSRDVTPQVTVLEDIQFDAVELADYRRHINDNELFTPEVLNLLGQFENAKTFGSLIQPVLSEQKIIALRELLVTKEPVGDLYLLDTHQKVMCVLEQAEALTQRNHVVVANPPYMGTATMNLSLKNYVNERYPKSKSDLMTCFMEKSTNLCIVGGFWGMINLPSWMFLQSFDDIRRLLIHTQSIISLLQLGRGIFGSDFGSVAFVIRNTQPHVAQEGIYRRLFERQVEVRKPDEIQKLYLSDGYGKYIFRQSDFATIPGSPIAYWVSSSIARLWSGSDNVANYTISDGQNKTGNNERFLRFHWEIVRDKYEQGIWIPYAKGGPWRKWFGNTELLVDWSSNARNHYRKDKIARLIPDYLWYKKGISWSFISSKSVGFRFLPAGGTFDVQGSTLFLKDETKLEVILALLNSKPVNYLLRILNPTISLQVKDVRSVPIPSDLSHIATTLICERATHIAKWDWDSDEVSMEFLRPPLLNAIRVEQPIEIEYRNLRTQWRKLCDELHDLEEANNRFFIGAYGIADEVTPDVSRNEITLTCNPAYRYGGERGDDEYELLLLADTMRDFISYAVGCMFGRYSLEEPGLILANQGETLHDYLKRIPEPSFPADEDNVIPVLDGEWFSDDIVERFKQFLRITFGEASYVENLRFIEAALGTDTKPKSIRDYFVKDFYNDHIKRYKKRPIYWMFTSPKGTFNALIYMHRYRPDTVSLVLNNYLREFRTKLVSHKAHLEAVSISAGSSQADKTKALKEIEKIAKAIVELEDYERDVLYPLATEQLAIDLDDGVKVNYLKFGSALKKIPGLEAKED
jgi:hypothetical protein